MARVFEDTDKSIAIKRKGERDTGSVGAGREGAPPPFALTLSSPKGQKTPFALSLSKGENSELNDWSDLTPSKHPSTGSG